MGKALPLEEEQGGKHQRRQQQRVAAGHPQLGGHPPLTRHSPPTCPPSPTRRKRRSSSRDAADHPGRDKRHGHHQVELLAKHGKRQRNAGPEIPQRVGPAVAVSQDQRGQQREEQPKVEDKG